MDRAELSKKLGVDIEKVSAISYNPGKEKLLVFLSFKESMYLSEDQMQDIKDSFDNIFNDKSIQCVVMHGADIYFAKQRKED